VRDDPEFLNRLIREFNTSAFQCYPEALPPEVAPGRPAAGAIGDGAGREVADADGYRPSAVFARRDRPQ